MPDPNQPQPLFSFAILSDLHLSELNGIDKLQLAIDSVKREKNLAFVQILGDVMYEGSLGEFKKILDGFELPYHMTLGNYEGVRLREFRDAFGPAYYTFEHKNCLFVSLYNALPALDDVHAHHGEIDGEQGEWLKNVLEQASKRQTEYQKIILFAHIPPLQPGSPKYPGFRMTVESTDFIYDLCREYMVDACFYGHIHHNEAFEYEDTWHIATPSTNWNFNTSFGYLLQEWVPVDYGGYRIVHVFAEDISDELRWTHRGFEPIESVEI